MIVACCVLACVQQRPIAISGTGCVSPERRRDEERCHGSVPDDAAQLEVGQKRCCCSHLAGKRNR